VLVTHTEGLYTHRILVECKHWNKPVQRVQIDAMIASVEDLNAAKGVVFTSQGYQSGAQTMAEFKGVEVFKVRELMDDEWGSPGRVIDVFLQVVSLAYGNIAFPEAVALALPGSAPPEALAIAIYGGAVGFESKAWTAATGTCSPSPLRTASRARCMRRAERRTGASPC
jgi:Restriction endonuclease